MPGGPYIYMGGGEVLRRITEPSTRAGRRGDHCQAKGRDAQRCGPHRNDDIRHVALFSNDFQALYGFTVSNDVGELRDRDKQGSIHAQYALDVVQITMAPSSR